MFNYFLFDPERYFFNRMTKDMRPYTTIDKDDGKLHVLLNVLGVAKENIEVDVRPTDSSNRQLLVISGKTHNELIDKDYSVNMEFFVKPLKTLEWDTKDGLMTLELVFEEPVKPQVDIRRK